jgi:M6 family metalloprotease-like protein
MILMLLLSCALAAVAVPAKPGWVTLKQSDGTLLRVQAVGNAFNHALLTSDGLMVALGDDGDYYYKSSLTGMSTVLAHEPSQRSASERAFIVSQHSNLTMTHKEFKPIQGRPFFGVGGSNADADVPSLGARKVPIILVEYQDRKFNNTREQIIQAMLTGNTSVQQYFKDQSNGKYDPDFEVFGIYTLSQNRQYYGGNTSGGDDKGLGSMVTEACQMAAADGVSFNRFDTNSDNYCDVVIVIYAGVGEAQASYTVPSAIWPCNWNLQSASYYGMGGNGAFRPNGSNVYVNNFAVFNELHGSSDNTTTIDGIGTFCHEFGHCLGLPDFYDTNYGGHYGMGYWDIMDTGCYANDTYTPVGYSAYEKNFMGWIDYVIPHPGTHYTLPIWNQKNEETDKALFLQSDINSNEYFIIENRRQQGWDRYLPGQGLLIHHITYSAERWSANTPNNQNIQLVTIMPADNSLSTNNESGDTWPRNDKSAFTDNSTPAAKLNMTASGNITGNAGYLGKPVTEMTIHGDGTASFWYMKGAITDPTIQVSAENVNCGATQVNSSVTKTFSVTGLALTNDITLTLNDPNGVFTVNPTVINSSNATNGVTVTVTFSPTAVQNYTAELTLASNGAENVTVNLTGQGLIKTHTPVMQPAVEEYINLTEFRADWTDQTPAENVTSYTLEVRTKPDGPIPVEGGVCDLTDVEAVTNDNGTLPNVASTATDYLPDGWSAENIFYVNNGFVITGASSSWWSTTYGALVSPTLDLTGNNKVTVVARIKSYYPSSYGVGQVRISTGSAQSDFTLGSSDEDDFQEITVVLNCSSSDRVRVQARANYIAIESVYIYAGDITTGAKFSANETGDAAYRLITDITDRFYTVTGLEAEGTYVYKVKALYTDGTESEWSNQQEVTLFQNGHGFELGDVNHDGTISILDVTILIDYLLGNAEVCTICADLSGDNNISILDVTMLSDQILSGN